MDSAGHTFKFSRCCKLFICYFAAALAALFIAYTTGVRYLNKEVENQVLKEAHLDSTVFKSDFLNYMTSLRNEIKALSGNMLMRKLVVDLANGYSGLGPQAHDLLAAKYGREKPVAKPAPVVPATSADAAKNIAPTDKDAAAAEAPPAAPTPVAANPATPALTPEQQAAVTEALTFYDTLHTAYDPIFGELEKSLSLYDVLIIDPNGNIIYSKEKYGDFAANVLTDEKLKESDLNAVFQELQASLQAGGQSGPVLHDAKPYAPAGGVPSALLAAPIADGDHLLGAIVFRLPLAPTPSTFNFGEMLKVDENIFVLGKDAALSYSVNSVPFHPALLEFLKSGKLVMKISPQQKRVFGKEEVEFLGNKWLLVSQLNLTYRQHQSASPLIDKLTDKYTLIAAAMGGVFLIFSLLFARKRQDGAEGGGENRMYRKSWRKNQNPDETGN